MLLPIFLWSAAYLVGSIPFGWLFARAKGIDIFQEGSGNIGATNVGRVLGKRIGIVVLVLDFAKGALPVTAALMFAGESTLRPGLLEVGAGLAAFLGHLFPIYLGFRGGKGIATGAGVVAVLFPLAALAALLAFLATATATRYVSLAALFAAAVLLMFYLLHQPAIDATDPRTAFALFAVALVFYRHRGNIARLRAGSEPQLGPSPLFESVARSMHVLSLGMWCGMGVFFTFVVALALFHDFEAIGKKPAAERPNWLPLPTAFQTSDDTVKNAPKEQGSRAAGYAVSGLFPTYFLLQFLCGVVAFGTALGWPKRRRAIIGLALLLAIAGWPLERKVADLRPIRNDAVDAYLQADPARRDSLRPALVSARDTFGGWHVVSLFLNFGTVGLVVVATAMAGNLIRENS